MAVDRSEWPETCPRPPGREEDLDFRRKPMVDWLAPGELASTGMRAAMAAVFGSYADKREVQAALHPLPDDPEALYEDRSRADGDFWLDYMADTGDGFDATYSLAWLLSRPSLRVAPAAEDPDEPARGEPLELPRGRVLVLGGDQVYPTATFQEYTDRLRGPFRAAFPWGPAREAPFLYAIPGNHDWYDGLTSFTRLFCQQRWIGGWRTRQKRSYFALKLPHGWWLWGTDIQLAADIDQPQVDYFTAVAEEMHRQAEAVGDGPPRLVLCTAQPQWVYCDDEPPGPSESRRSCRLPVEPEAFRSLAWFHRAVVLRHGIRLEAMISGDLHHYVHYRRAAEPAGAETAGLPEADRAAAAGAPDDGTPEAGAPSRLITSGGGGAYLYPTHHMPDRLRVPFQPPSPGRRQEVSVPYRREGVFPSRDDSKRLALLSWVALPWRNRGFAYFLAFLYLLFAWLTQSATNLGFVTRGEGGGRGGPDSLLATLARFDWGDFDQVVKAFWAVTRHSPSSTVFALLVVFGLWKFRQSGGSPGDRGVAGVVHGVAHLLLACWLIWFFARVNLHWLPWDLHPDHVVQVLLFVAEMLLFGGLLGGWLFGLYLVLTGRFSGAHLNEVFSAQRLPDYKNFLRLRIAPSGELTVHAVGVPRVPRKWRYRGADPDLEPGAPWFEPEEPISPQLIEPPFPLPPERGGGEGPREETP